MEFELERTQLDRFDALLDTTLHQEETLEMIVPDACPDILRIVETDGRVLLRSKEAHDGRAELAGTFKAAILYLPDGESGVRHLDVTIPFACSTENREIRPDCVITATARLSKADTRAVNPRKVLVRVEATVDIQVFAPRQDQLCSHVLDGTEGGIQQRIQTEDVCLIAGVQEKPFPFSDEVTISAGRPAAAELLKNRITLECGESKIIGNKLIFKGSARISVLYRGEDDAPHTVESDLPFSQIMEVSGVTEDAGCNLSLALTGAECELSEEGDGRTITVRVEALAQAVIQERRTLAVLTDAYSVDHSLHGEWEESVLDILVEQGVRNQNIRELWETTEEIREILESQLRIGEIAQTREESQHTFTALIELELLYLNENEELCSTSHSFHVPCGIESVNERLCSCRCQQMGDLFVTPAAGGLEARFSLDFAYQIFSKKSISSLSELYPVEAAEGEGERPSLILRMLEQGEALWDVAKAYGTTINDIISVNELSDESAAAGKLLLIPRRR